MTPAELIDELKRAGIKLAVVENDLVIRGKKQTLTSNLLTQIREHKLALLDLLQTEARTGLVENGGEPSPQKLAPLVELTPAELAEIAKSVPGGMANVQDIYPLAPLQEGIFFHHLLDAESDAYLLLFLSSFDTRALLDRYVAALKGVIDRNDILRTAIVWEGLPEPVQVVWRKAPLVIEEIEIDPAEGDVSEQLCVRCDPRRLHLDLRQAPLMRLHIAYDRVQDRWLMLMLLHHLAGDHTTVDVIQEEIGAYLMGHEDRLPKPLPFRNLVEQARHGVSLEEHEAFFRQMLGDVDEPTAPFGLLDVRGDGTGIEEAHLDLDRELALRLRASGRRLGITVASLFHLAWAKVLAETAGRTNVVFGTVLFGRMQGGVGADRVMGLFINTLPVRITADEEGVAASARRTHALLAELMRHEHASLALAQRCSAVPTPAPLFSSILNYRYGAEPLPSEESLAVWKGIHKLCSEERTNYPLTLSVNDLGSGFSLDAQTTATTGPTRVCEYMCTALESLADALELAPTTAVRALEVLPVSERRKVLYEWNATGAAYPNEVPLAKLIEEQVERTPDGVAVVYGEQKLTYRKLNALANQLARELRKLGAGPDKTVGMYLERSTDMIVALLAIVKVGAAYLPLDPLFPPDRLAYMLEDSGTRLLVSQRSLRGDLPNFAGTLILLEDKGWQANPEQNLAVAVGPEHLAYLIYTSGSTGKPKGVQVPRGALTNLLWSVRDWLQFSDRDRLLAVTTISFDIAAADVWLPLVVGAQLVVASRESAADGDALRDLLERQNITFLQATPITWRLLFEAGWRGKQDMQAVCTGEAMPPEVAAQLAPVVKRLWNLYGPTETTVWSTGYEVTDGEKKILIGRPLANTQCYILDAQRRPVPIGVTGELYIGGDGLARGYQNRPELTAEKFLPDPFRTGGARMYRTGDLARYLPDGNMECLGRIDHQVKIRGYRIELGEIEAILKDQPEINQAVVIVREDTPGDKRLAAYYTPSRTGESEEVTVTPEQFRSRLSTALPEYMIPVAYVRMESLPLTPNGKLDRKALPAPEADSSSTRSYEPPQGETETKLAAIWAEVLKLDRVGRHDNFFDLGGHSLLAVQLMVRLQKIIPGAPVPLRSVLEAPTVERFAIWLQNRKQNGPEILVQIREGSSIRPPFFCVHASDGTALGMRPFAMNLDEGLPFYCLQGKGLDGSAPFNTVEEAAHCYLEVIREIQPHGPYYLGGYCFGGNVAFEMARMLKQLGEPVAPIVLIDSFNPAYSRSITKSDMLFRLLRFYIRRVAFHTRRIFSLSPTIWIQYTTGRIKAMYVHAQRYVKKAFKGGNEWPVDPTSAEVDAAINASLEQILKRMQKAGPNATRKFVPKPYSGDALVVRVSERNTDPYEDYFLGWRPVIKGALESIEIDSTHEDILREPAVRLMAAIIDARLRKYSSGIALPPAARIDPESPDAAAPMMEEEPVDYPLAH